MARDGTLRIRILGDDSDAQNTLSRLQDSLGDFASAAAVPIAGAATIGAGIFVSTFVEALDRDAMNDRLAAALSLDEATAERVARLSSDIFAGAWGDSIEEVNEAIGSVGRNLTDLADTSDDDIRAMTTAALDLAAVFDQDVNEVVRTASILIANGLARDAEHAFDILTAGFQGGADRSHDFLDTLNEYAEPLRSMGIDGERATDIIVRGLDEGVFTADKLIDALKEFTIRAVDGSTATREAYESLGLDADELAGKILAGGEASQQATDTIITALAAMSDPVARETAGVALFGTMWEDVGGRVLLNALDPMQRKIEDVEGATVRMSETSNDNLKTKLVAGWRTLQEKVLEFADIHVLPAMGRIVDALESDGLAGGVAQLRKEWDAAWPKLQAFWNDTVLPWLTEVAGPALIDVGEWIGREFVGAMGRGIAAELNKLRHVIPGAGAFADLFELGDFFGNLGGSAPPKAAGSGGGGGGGSFALAQLSGGDLQFAHGGPVPGPSGMARTITAHGGERVLTADQDAIFQQLAAQLLADGVGGEIHVHVEIDGREIAHAVRRHDRGLQ